MIIKGDLNMRRVLFLISMTMIALFLVACDEAVIQNVNNETNNDVQENNNGTSEDSNHIENNLGTNETSNDDEKIEGNEEELELVSKENNDEPIINEMGDTVHFNDLHITLNDAYLSEGGEWETPFNDYYLILDLSIENTADEPKNVSTLLQMSVVDDENYSYDITIFTETKGSLDGEIGPGRTTRGEVAFDVDSSSYYEFVYEDPFRAGQAIWRFEAN